MIKLYKGDCLEVMKDIPDGSIDTILCDLPYGITCVACKLQNRSFIGIEQDEKYFEIGVKRMNETHNLMV